MTAWKSYGAILGIAAALALIPLVVTSNPILNFLVFALMVALAAQGWNILGGYAGQISFGHAAFFGTGGYTTAVLQLSFGLNAWLGLAVGILLGIVVGAFVGYLSFRAGLRGSYFALITLAFAEVLRIVANTLDITGGGQGILIALDMRPENFQFQSRAVFFWIILAFVTVIMLVTRFIERTRLGMQLIAVRENEVAAQSLGVDAFRTKMVAIMISSAISAAAGAFYAQYFLFLDSSIAYGAWISVEALVAAVIGGAGTVVGPVLGALVLHIFGELATHFAGNVPGINLAIYGLLLILAVAFLPGGLLGGVTTLTERLRSSKGGRSADR